eukprot:CAMPEP_0201658206 /NCGR_PEP_ID=MMETSP0494-20130426/1182_1 /ASSEMBLY_ACC=CAM_ASM_000839 /TAXON_ID=420259 /ORGANISM="Thalassiosira gravida, Strain GMp14c1" /LENGTH=247 /DNA_ID=CAMNT_0048135171 /DNA_START=29 /DNA_END=772 /DNA_ORIENTATION=-
MVKTTTAASATNKKKNDSSEVKPYNRYNIYFILERQHFLQSNTSYKQSTPAAPSSNFITGYESLDLPDLPPRYTSLDLPFDWYMPGKRKAARRDHRKSHGLASFKDIARLVADGYKTIDDVTLEYVTTVAEILKQRHKEMKKSRRLDLRRSAAADSHRSSLSNCDTNWDESAQYYPTQPRHNHWASPPRMSMSENFHVEAIAPSCPYNSPPREYSPNPNGCVGVDASRSISEVDMDDGDIIRMWHYN